MGSEHSKLDRQRADLAAGFLNLFLCKIYTKRDFHFSFLPLFEVKIGYILPQIGNFMQKAKMYPKLETIKHWSSMPSLSLAKQHIHQNIFIGRNVAPSIESALCRFRSGSQWLCSSK